MNTYCYDGTYEGLLTVVFEAFRHKIFPDLIATKENYQPTLLGKAMYIETDEEKASRVLKGIAKHSSTHAVDSVLKAFLTELQEIELLLFRYIQHLVRATKNAEEDYSNSYVLKVKQLNKQIDREVHRMHAFVRFQKTTDALYYASITPDFNVLPLIGEHFEKRYADQRWMIFDAKRAYGLYYDLNTTSIVLLDEALVNFRTGALDKSITGEKETDYQALWKNYFDSVNIKERKNTKSHLQKLPKRYWKFLPEKRTDQE